jgi:hypothetical protein
MHLSFIQLIQTARVVTLASLSRWTLGVCVFVPLFSPPSFFPSLQLHRRSTASIQPSRTIRLLVPRPSWTSMAALWLWVISPTCEDNTHGFARVTQHGLALCNLLLLGCPLSPLPPRSIHALHHINGRRSTEQLTVGCFVWMCSSRCV